MITDWLICRSRSNSKQSVYADILLFGTRTDVQTAVVCVGVLVCVLAGQQQ